MNILVTGGAGFIGSNYINRTLEKFKNAFIVNYDNFTYAANINNLHPSDNKRYKLIVGDILDQKLLLQAIIEHKIEYIINFAAETHVDHSIYGGAEEFIQTNIVGVMTILNLLRDYNKQLKIRKLIHISTDEVYGSLQLGENRKFHEDSLFNPSTPYAGSKAGGDLLCAAYYNTFKLPIIVTHTTNNYGINQHVEKLIPLCINRLTNGQRLIVHGDGRHIRDWIHVDDNCDAINFILERGKIGEAYNIGVNNEQSNLEVMKLILEAMEYPDNYYELVSDRPGNDRRYALSSKKLQDLGWIPPKRNFKDEIFGLVDYYLNNA